jgi:hypothetical protein
VSIQCRENGAESAQVRHSCATRADWPRPIGYSEASTSAGGSRWRTSAEEADDTVAWLCAYGSLHPPA